MQIVSYEIVDHGVEHEQYFQGCGVAFTKFTDCYTGMGNSPHEALEDAVEQSVTSGCNFNSEQSAEIQALIDSADATDYSIHAPDETKHVDCGDEECFAADMHYYVSIRVVAQT